MRLSVLFRSMVVLLSAVAWLPVGLLAQKTLPEVDLGGGNQFPITNARVYDVEQTNQFIYVAGEQTQYTFPTGNGGLVDGSTGAVQPGWPDINDVVTVAKQDPTTGSWYIGGAFTQVDGNAIPFLAKIYSNGTVDPNFVPSPNNVIYDLEIIDGKLYVSGAFTQIGTPTGSRLNRNYLARLDTANGDCETWDAQITSSKSPVNFGAGFNFNSSVVSMAYYPTDGFLYIGGLFSDVLGTNQEYLAALDIDGAGNNPTLHSNFTPQLRGDYREAIQTWVNYNANAVEPAQDNTVYPRESPDVVSPPGPTIPNLDNLRLILDMEILNDRLYVAGSFTGIYTGTVDYGELHFSTRMNLAAFDLSTANDDLDSWYVEPQVSPIAYNDPSTLPGYQSFTYPTFQAVFLGGSGSAQDLAFKTEYPVAASDPNNVQVSLGINPNQANVSDIEITGDGRVLLAGSFRILEESDGDWWNRSNVAIVDPATGDVDDNFEIHANNSGIVRASAGNGGIYLAGDFTQLYEIEDPGEGSCGGSKGFTRFHEDAGSFNPALFGCTKTGGSHLRNLYAQVNLTDGAPTNWDPVAAGLTAFTVAAASNGSGVFIGGDLESFGGVNQPYLMRVDVNTGALDQGFTPDIDGPVYSLHLTQNEDSLLIGGMFSQVNSTARTRLAALNTSNGSLLPWAPSADDTVWTFTQDENDLYIGGAFTQVNGAPRGGAALLDLTVGNGQGAALQSWDPGANGSIKTILVDGDTVYLGGLFTSLDGGTSRNLLGCVSGANATLLGWNPNIVGNSGFEEVTKVLNYQDQLVVLGNFTLAGGDLHRSFAKVRKTDGSPVEYLNAGDNLTTLNDNSQNAGGYDHVRDGYIQGSRLYMTGTFSEINGTMAEGLTWYDLHTDSLGDWRPLMEIEFVSDDGGFSMDYNPQTRRLVVGGDYDFFYGGSTTSQTAYFSRFDSVQDMGYFVMDTLDDTYNVGDPLTLTASGAGILGSLNNTVELSDSLGDFSNPTELAKLNPFNQNDLSTQVRIPEDMEPGSHYRIRIRYNGLSGTGLNGGVPTDEFVIESPYDKFWIGGAPGNEDDWHTAANWSPSGAPTSTDIVMVGEKNYCPTISGTDADAKAFVTAGCTTTVNAGRTLSIDSTVTLIGGVLEAEEANFELNGAQAQTLEDTFTVGTLTINNANGVTLNAPVYVRQGVVLTSGALTTNGNLTLLADSLNVAYIQPNGGSISGNIVAESYLRGARGYKFVGFPVTGQSFSTIPFKDGGGQAYTPILNQTYNTQGPNLHPFPTLFYYDEPNRDVPGYTDDAAAWKVPAPSANIDPGQGLLINVFPTAPTLEYTGTPNDGPYTQTVTHSAGQGTPGYNFLANPYPSGLDFDDFQNSNSGVLEDGLWVWQSSDSYSGTYGTYINGVSSNVRTNAHIEQGQGFFVRALPSAGAGATVNFNNSMREYVDTTNFQKTSGQTPDLLRLEVQGPNNRDGIVTYREDRASTNTYDMDYDTRKLFSFQQDVTQLWIDNQGLFQQIDGRAPLGMDSKVQLNLAAPSADTLTLEATHIENYDPTVRIFLHDHKLNKRIDLRNQPAYTFAYTPATDTHRFSLEYTAALEVETELADCEGQNGAIQLRQPSAMGWKFSLKDAQGNLVNANNHFYGAHRFDNLPAGDYTMTLMDDAWYTVQQQLTVGQKPSVEADFQVDNGLKVLAGEPVQFRSSTRRATQLSWSFGDNQGASADPDPVYTFAEPGVYTVRLQASNDACNTTVEKVIVVEAAQVTANPEALSRQEPTARLVNGVLNIQFHSLEQARGAIVVRNVLGQTLAEVDNSNTASLQAQLPLYELADQVLLLTLDTDQRYSLKVVAQDLR